MKYNYEDENLVLKLEEELDMSSCRVLKDIMDGYIIKYQPKQVEIDLSGVKFMDSSGIGLLMGRYNLTRLMDSDMIITNPNSNVKRLLELSNISNQITLRSE